MCQRLLKMLRCVPAECPEACLPKPPRGLSGLCAMGGGEVLCSQSQLKLKGSSSAFATAAHPSKRRKYRGVGHLQPTAVVVQVALGTYPAARGSGSVLGRRRVFTCSSGVAAQRATAMGLARMEVVGCLPNLSHNSNKQNALFFLLLFFNSNQHTAVFRGPPPLRVALPLSAQRGARSRVEVRLPRRTRTVAGHSHAEQRRARRSLRPVPRPAALPAPPRRAQATFFTESPRVARRKTARPPPERGAPRRAARLTAAPSRCPRRRARSCRLASPRFASPSAAARPSPSPGRGNIAMLQADVRTLQGKGYISECL